MQGGIVNSWRFTITSTKSGECVGLAVELKPKSELLVRVD